MAARISVGAAAMLLIAVACGGDSSNGGDGGPDGSTDGTFGDSGNPGDAQNPNDGSQPPIDSGPCDAGGQSTTDFPSTSTIYQDISAAPIDSQWTGGLNLSSIIAGGFGSAFQLDPSFTVNYADACLQRRTFTQPQSAQPDCDTAPMPVPPGGATEGYQNYFCGTKGDDCHMIVYQGTRLYELYQGSITGGQSTGGTFTGTCLAVWDLTHDYWQAGSPFSRGDGCNGPDAADMPIAPLLLKKDEIAAHSIKHALRFTIGNDKIDDTYYVHPTTHLGGAGTNKLPYGTRLRLKSTFNVASLPNAEAQAVAVALQKYGMFLDDGGNFFVSATTDITQVIDTHDLKTLAGTDFEMVEAGTRYNFHQQNCTRTVITN